MRINPLVAALVSIPISFAGYAVETISVSFLQGYDPDRPEDPVSRQILDLAKREKKLDPQKWGGLSLPGAGGRAAFMLSMAGDTAPDIYQCWFHIMRHDIEQGFLHPLNEWLGDDLDGDGKLSDAEAKWDGWRYVPRLWREVATKDGKVYGIPQAGMWYYGIVYRKDLVKQAGIDPEYVPGTWDEFFKWCQRLTFPRKLVAGSKLNRGQRAFGAENRPWAWLPWVQSAGGELIVRTNGQWRANFDSEEAVAAAEFFKKLAWSPWIRNHENGEPIDLTERDIASGMVTDPKTGKTINFKKDDVISGVVRALPRLTQDLPLLFAQGEVVALFSGAELVEQLTRDANLPPEMVGIMPFPARDRSCRPVLQAHKHFYGMTEKVGRRSKEERDMVWKCLESLASRNVNDQNIRQKVLEGNARWCNPRELKRLGLEEYLGEVPESVRIMYNRLESGEIASCTEPYAGFWQAVSDLVDRRLLGMLLADGGAGLDCRTVLKSINDDANSGLMFKIPEAVMAERRPLARVIFGVVLIVAIAIAYILWKRDE